MMYEKSDTKQLQAVLTDKERAVMQAVIQESGMKQKYWLRKLILDAIHPSDTGNGSRTSMRNADGVSDETGFLHSP